MSRGPLITRLGQLAASGEWRMRRAPLLGHLTPERYVGLDLHPADLAYAERRFGRLGYEFVQADFMEAPLEPWRGADVVTASAVFHHLTDQQVVELVGRLQDQVRPGRMVFTDGVTRGPLAGVLTRLDEGEPSRPREVLYELFRPRFEVVETWSYVVPFRTYLYFGFELTP